MTDTEPSKEALMIKAREAYLETMRSLFGKVPSAQYYAVHSAFKAFADITDARRSAEERDTKNPAADDLAG